MKVLILHNQLWSQYKSIVFEYIYHSLRDSNDEVLVLQTSISEKSRKSILTFSEKDFPYQFPYKLLFKKSLEEVNPYATAWEWLKTIWKYRPSVVNLTGYSELGTLPVLLLCKLIGSKTIMTNESVYSHLHFQGHGFKKFLKWKYKIFIFKLTDAFFSYGINSNDFLFRHGVPKKKIVSFLNTFDKSKFKTSIKVDSDQQTGGCFLYVGRLSEEKNPDGLLDLAKICQNLLPNYVFKLVGDGPQEQYLQERIIKEKISNVILEGSVNWEQLQNIYSTATLLLIPSISETWGMVANESVEMGVPVVSTQTCGCSNDLVVHGFNGMVFPDFKFETNPSQLNDFLEFVKKLESNRNRYKMNALRTALIYDIERLGKESVEAIKNLAT